MSDNISFSIRFLGETSAWGNCISLYYEVFEGGAFVRKQLDVDAAQDRYGVDEISGECRIEVSGGQDVEFLFFNRTDNAVAFKTQFRDDILWAPPSGISRFRIAGDRLNGLRILWASNQTLEGAINKGADVGQDYSRSIELPLVSSLDWDNSLIGRLRIYPDAMTVSDLKSSLTASPITVSLATLGRPDGAGIVYNELRGLVFCSGNLNQDPKSSIYRSNYCAAIGSVAGMNNYDRLSKTKIDRSKVVPLSEASKFLSEYGLSESGYIVADWYASGREQWALNPLEIAVLVVTR